MPGILQRSTVNRQRVDMANTTRQKPIRVKVIRAMRNRLVIAPVEGCDGCQTGALKTTTGEPTSHTHRASKTPHGHHAQGTTPR